MGVALTIATLTEIPVFFFGDRLVKRFGSYGLFMIALVLVGIRSLLYAVASTAFHGLARSDLRRDDFSCDVGWQVSLMRMKTHQQG